MSTGALRASSVRDLGDIWKRLAFEGGQRIIHQQRTSQVFSSCLGHPVKSFLQPQRPRSHVVRVAGNEVDRSGIEPMLRSLLRQLAEMPGKRLRRNLRVAALLQPVKQPGGLRADQGIALGMRDDRAKPRQVQFVEGVVERCRNRIVGAFDEEIIFLVERIAGGIVTNVLEIFEAEMEIAPRRENEASLKESLNFVAALFYQFGVETVGLIRMGSSNDVRNPVFNGHFRHGAGDFKGLGAVIEARKYVAMNVNHLPGRIAQAGMDDNEGSRRGGRERPD